MGNRSAQGQAALHRIERTPVDTGVVAAYALGAGPARQIPMVQFPGNEGTILNISEAYGHAPILPYQADETASCPLTSCARTAVQCVDVTAPVVLAPATTIGTPVVTCQGEPTVHCTSDTSGTSCFVTLTQEICVSIPVCYGVTLTSGEATIACAGNSSTAEAGGSCGCGCGRGTL